MPLAGVVATTIVLANGRRARAPALGLAFALLGPLATSPWVRPFNWFADRYMVIPTLGGAILWGWLIDRALYRLRVPKMWMQVALVAALASLIGASFRALSCWRSEHALWATAIERAPRSPRAWVGWAYVLRGEGNLDESDRAVAHAVELDPEYMPARVNRALNAMLRGNIDPARDDLRVVTESGTSPPGFVPSLHCAELERTQAMSCARDLTKRN